MLLGDDGDLMVENGGLVIGQTDDQNVSLLIASSPGSNKQYPLLGVSLIEFINKQGVSMDHIKRRIRVHLAADGYEVRITNKGGEFNVEYEDGTAAV